MKTKQFHRLWYTEHFCLAETKSFDLPVIVTTDFEPKKQEKSDKKSEKQEPENYLDYVQQRTEQEELEPAKNLIYKLGMLNVDQKIIEAAILDQYKVAVKKKVGKFTIARSV